MRNGQVARSGARGVWLCVAGVVALVLVACNTVKGVGKDLEKAGDAMQDAAQ